MKTFTCPHCNQAHPAGARFCPVTGETIPEIHICSSCGEQVHYDWKVCPQCGGSLGEEGALRKIQPGERTHGKSKRRWLVGVLILGVLVLVGAVVAIGRDWWSGYVSDISAKPGLWRTPRYVSAIPIGKTPTPPAGDQLPTRSLPVQAGTLIPKPIVSISPMNAGQVVELARWGKGLISEVAYSPDGKLLAVATSIGIYFYDTNTLAEVRIIESNSSLTSVAFSPDGSLLASGSDDEAVILWHLSDGSQMRRLAGHTNWVSSVAFSPDGDMLASGSGDGTVILWRVSDGSQLRTLAGRISIYSVAFSPDGGLLASGSGDRIVRLWRVSDGMELRTQAEHASGVYRVAFSPDGGMLASGSYDGTVILWRVSDGIELRTLAGHTDYVSSMAFSPDGSILASGSGDGTVKLWRVADGGQLRTLEGHTSGVRSVAFSPDGLLLATGSYDGTIRIWGVAP
jgi:uncharacterized protein YjiK